MQTANDTMTAVRVWESGSGNDAGFKEMRYIPVIVLATVLFAIMPVCAEETHATGIKGEPNELWFISIDPVGNYYSGDTILIRGSTNIPATEKLLLEVYSSSYRHQPRNPFTEYGISRTVTLLPGRDGSANYWLAEITTTNWSGDEYLAAVSWRTYEDTRPEVYASQLFTILPADNRKTENSLAGIATLPVLSDQPDVHVTQTRTAIQAPAQPAALPGIIPPAAIGGIIATVGLKKIWRVK